MPSAHSEVISLFKQKTQTDECTDMKVEEQKQFKYLCIKENEVQEDKVVDVKQKL